MGGILLCGGCVACDLDDDRDICCENSNGAFMKFKYIYKGENVIESYIYKMSHFFFPEVGPGGIILENLPLSPMMKLDIQTGRYRSVSIGNPSENLNMRIHDELDGGRYLEQLGVRADPEDPAYMLSCGELYGGKVEVDRRDIPLQIFTTFMNNLHCRLEFRVEWENRPPANGQYEIRLRNVPINYIMTPELWYSVGEYCFPKNDGRVGNYRKWVGLEAQMITSEFLTLRYSNNRIPVLEIFFQNNRITPPLDLKRAFSQWGWRPDADTVQLYRIKIIIKIDGSVIIRPWIEGDVADWIDGGTFS